jgi:hypothetical protein
MSREWLLWLSSRVADAMIEALDDMLPPSTAVDRSFMTSRCIATLGYAAATPTSPAHMAGRDQSGQPGHIISSCEGSRSNRPPPLFHRGVLSNSHNSFAHFERACHHSAYQRFGSRCTSGCGRAGKRSPIGAGGDTASCNAWHTAGRKTTSAFPRSGDG